MNRRKESPAPRPYIIAILVVLSIVAIQNGFVLNAGWYWLLAITLPLLGITIFDITQTKHALTRNYPLVGRLRYLFESIRPEMRQYFFESDLDGKPFNRRQRSIVYQRAKNEKQTVAFGMQADPNASGYEWVSHSVYPIQIKNNDLRTLIGNKQCGKPYNASILNIGAMSYGSLSKTAIRSLNEGAFFGGFAHNTGEGGISQHHLNGGDLIWQIGTGYFGCRDEEGNFSPEKFQLRANLSAVKMIELKLSQGAKPGHGGILPAAKNTEEIAAIRDVAPGQTIHSPTTHSTFSNAEEMMHFIGKLRILSGGKPVGFKICIGDKKEFNDICRSIVSTGIIPDFITVDGAEGGTGAAPLEFTDHLGMPLYEALTFVKQSLDRFKLSGQIKLIAAGKIITGFDILKAISLGASACYSARGMMMSLGCIQALICDTGRCPVGIATQNPSLARGIDPAEKRVRVKNFHEKTIAATREIMEACAFNSIEDVKASRFYRRTSNHEMKSFEEIFFKKNFQSNNKIDHILN